MQLATIAFNNLRRRTIKMAFLTIGLAVGIATIVTLITLTSSMSHDIERKMEEFGANILITPQSTELAMNYAGLSLGAVTFDQREIREEDLTRIKTIKNHQNISAVSPKVLGGVRINDKPAMLVGVDFASELKMKLWWKIFGNEPTGENDILLGSDAGKIFNVMPGDPLAIKGENFTVAGILEQTGSQDDALIFMSLRSAQKILNKKGIITLVEVAALCSGCPIGDMVTQIAEKLPEAKVSAIQQVVATRLHALDQFKRFSLAMAGVVVFIGSLIVFITMMGSVAERTTEIGVFRAIGFRKAHIMRIILLEAVVVSFVAGFLGYLLGMSAAKIALPFMTEGKNAALDWNGLVALGAPMLAVCLGVLASIYPARHASHLDPTESLRSL
jgi:putative ABC transport system permease protein